MFKRTVQQYDRFRSRNAFLDQYKKEPMFENGLEEFDSARWVASVALRHALTSPRLSLHREVAMELIEEYQACEKADYIVSCSQPLFTRPYD